MKKVVLVYFVRRDDLCMGKCKTYLPALLRRSGYAKAMQAGVEYKI